jgi:autotransporter translocation and assembly factor TamB
MSSEKSIPEMEVIEIGGDKSPEKEPQKDKKEVKKKAFKMGLDVTVALANNFIIKGYGLDSEWTGGLKIQGDASRPKVTGLIKTKQGSLDILSNRFVLERGLIAFNGAYPSLPSVDIKAVVDSGEGQAIIKIQGMVDDPKLELAHNPTKPQSEILSQLLFKTDTKTISPIQALKLAEAVTLLASGGLVNIDTLGSLESDLGLDRLDVGGDNFKSTSVKAGKYITDKIYLEVEKGLSSSSNKVTVEVDLWPEIKAEVEFDQNADSAIGLKWQHDY